MHLTRNEEIKLFSEYEVNHDLAIREKIIKSNKGLVVTIAKQYYRKTKIGLAFHDLIQEGNVGLIVAVDRFNYRRGLKFSTYASYYIKMRIRNFYKDRLIRIPAHVWAIKDHQHDFVKRRKVKIVSGDLYKYLFVSDYKDKAEVNLSNLNEKERFVIIKHYGLDGDDRLSLREIGEILGLTKEWVRKVEIKAMEKLRRINSYE